MAKNKKAAKSILDRARASQMKRNESLRVAGIHDAVSNQNVGEPEVETGDHPTDPRQ